MTKIELTKRVAKVVVGSSVGFSVNTTLQNNATTIKPIDKARAYIGATVAGVMAAEMTETWTDRKIDAAVSWWNENVKKA